MFPTACSFVPFFWLFYVILTSDVADVRVENGELFIVWRKKKIYSIFTKENLVRWIKWKKRVINHFKKLACWLLPETSP